MGYKPVVCMPNSCPERKEMTADFLPSCCIINWVMMLQEYRIKPSVCVLEKTVSHSLIHVHICQ